MRRYIYNLWLSVLGRLDSQLVIDLIKEIAEANYRAGIKQGAMEALKRDLELAKAGIAELKQQLKFDGEEGQRKASDSLGNAVLEDIERNPRKYLP